MMKSRFLDHSKRKREYLNDLQTRGLVKCLKQYFQSEMKIPRIRMGNEQETETPISEEALLLAVFLRNGKPSWRPRVPELPR